MVQSYMLQDYSFSKSVTGSLIQTKNNQLNRHTDSKKTDRQTNKEKPKQKTTTRNKQTNKKEKQQEINKETKDPKSHRKHLQDFGTQCKLAETSGVFYSTICQPQCLVLFIIVL